MKSIPLTKESMGKAILSMREKRRLESENRPAQGETEPEKNNSPDECLIRSRILTKSTWEEKFPSGFGNKYEQFFFLYVYFRMRDGGETEVNMGELLSDMGMYARNKADVEEVIRIISQCKYSEEKVLLPVFINELDMPSSGKMKLTSIIRMKAERNGFHMMPPFIRLKGNSFWAIVREAKENKICAASLLEFYLYFLSAMNEIIYKDKSIHCCMLAVSKIMEDLGITKPTLYKYRTILNQSGLIYYFFGGTKIASCYALEDDMDAYEAMLKGAGYSTFGTRGGINAKDVLAHVKVADARRKGMEMDVFGEGDELFVPLLGFDDPLLGMETEERWIGGEDDGWSIF